MTQETASADEDEADAPVHLIYRLETTLFGLYSTQGPLPTLHTEELLDEACLDQSVVKDFLDLIDNRLARYLYQAELHFNHPRRPGSGGLSRPRTELAAD